MDAYARLVAAFSSGSIHDANQKLTDHEHYKEIRLALESKARELCALELNSFLPFSKQFLEECTCIEGLALRTMSGHRAEPRLPASFVLEFFDCFKLVKLSKAQKLDLVILLRGAPEIDKVLADRKRCEELRNWPDRCKLIEKAIKSS